jgi:hypothetical protein
VYANGERYIRGEDISRYILVRGIYAQVSPRNPGGKGREMRYTGSLRPSRGGSPTARLFKRDRGD